MNKSFMILIICQFGVVTEHFCCFERIVQIVSMDTIKMFTLHILGILMDQFCDFHRIFHILENEFFMVLVI